MRIVSLCDAPHLAGEAARMIKEGWPDHYGPAGPGDADADILDRARASGLPFGLMSISDHGSLTGTAAVTGPSFGASGGEDIWLGGLYVRPPSRGKGIASALVAALENHARTQGFVTLYSTTSSAKGLLARMGWVVIRAFQDEETTWQVLQKDL